MKEGRRKQAEKRKIEEYKRGGAMEVTIRVSEEVKDAGVFG